MIRVKCDKCGDIDYGIWGYIGLVGFGLIIGAMGYVLSAIIYEPIITMIATVLGIMMLMPLWYIDFKEERHKKEEKTQ